MRARRLLALGAAVLVAGGLASARQASDLVVSLALFAGTPAGLWRSNDWGGTWTRVVGSRSGVSIDGIGPVRAIVPRGPEVYVAGDAGLFMSTDFGDTWISLSETRNVRSLLLSRWPQADPTVFVGTGSGLLRSRDGGRTFEPTGLAEGAVDRLQWPGPALVAAGSRGLLVTSTEGASFEGPGEGLPAGGVRAMALSSFFAVDPVLFAAAEAGGVYRSQDGGKHWRPAGLGEQSVRDLVWLGPFLYAAADGGFFRSEDVGRTWTRLSASPGEPRRLLFPLAPAAGLEAFLATDRGLFRTADAGQHWHPAGLQGEDVLTVATFPPPEPSLGRGKKPRR
jgi:photosystem II stability/assembly factor-like uncharacterized protein